MKKKVIIIGNSVTAQIIYSVLVQDNYEVTAFSVNKKYIKEKMLFSKPVFPLENLSDQYSSKEYELVNAVGYGNNNQNRAYTFNKAKEDGYRFLRYVHSSATVLSDRVNEGAFIMSGAVIEPYAIVNTNVVVWSNAVVAHHAQIDSHCWIASGSVIAGRARVGKNTFIGVNATIVNEVTVGEYNIIGAGALITKDTLPQAVYLARSGEKHRFSSDIYSKYCGDFEGVQNG